MVFEREEIRSAAHRMLDMFKKQGADQGFSLSYSWLASDLLAALDRLDEVESELTHEKVAASILKESLVDVISRLDKIKRGELV